MGLQQLLRRKPSIVFFKTSRNLSRGPLPNYTLKLSRPVVCPGLKPLDQRQRGGVTAVAVGELGSLNVIRGNGRAARTSARGPRPRSLT
jgi:hypothetical protein